MPTSFPRLLTLLRKEQKISQKDASKALGISQALLSHYENGIRECGLEFLVKAADYYQVSCDYLLGRTSSRSGTVPVESHSEKKQDTLLNSIGILPQILKRFNCPDLTDSVSRYLKLTVYKVFRLLYTANSKNPPNLFKLSKDLYRSQTNAELLLLENQIDLLARGKSVPNCIGTPRGECPELSMDTMEQENPVNAYALQSLIREIEP